LGFGTFAACFSGKTAFANVVGVSGLSEAIQGLVDRQSWVD
jgi:hypothetical protein